MEHHLAWSNEDTMIVISNFTPVFPEFSLNIHYLVTRSFIKKSSWKLLVKWFYYCSHIPGILSHSYTKLIPPNAGIPKFLYPQQQLLFVPFHLPLALTISMMPDQNSNCHNHNFFPQDLLCALCWYTLEVQAENARIERPVESAFH